MSSSLTAAKQLTPKRSSSSLGREQSTASTPGAGAPAAPAPSSAAAATQSLQLLLRDDPLLIQHELHTSKNAQEAAFSYAAALLGASDTGSGGVQQRATEALAEVDRKLILVHSLAERVSRTSPEAVAGPLLRLHGYTVMSAASTTEGSDGETKGELLEHPSTSATATTTLVATRDRCRRLQRQGEMMESVAKRVEASLGRGLGRMEAATGRLGRVLKLSATLKRILRLQFESSKLSNYDLEDLRDLTRAAAAVAVMEDLLGQIQDLGEEEEPAVVKALRPEAEATSAAVRKAAGELLEKHQSGAGVVQLGATLQVYYHLGELPDAAWSAVRYGLARAEEASEQFWSPTALGALMEQAQAQARSSSGGNKTESAMQRNLQKKLRSLRAEAASKWANGVAQAALQVWRLHRVLCRKSDPVSRQVFQQVVEKAPIPAPFAKKDESEDFSIFRLFWDKLCSDLGERLEELLNSGEHAKLAGDVAGMYPAVRASAIDMLGRLYDTMQAGSGSLSSLEDVTSSSLGILGGSAALEDSLIPSSLGGIGNSEEDTLVTATSADTWTRADTRSSGGRDQGFLTGGTSTTSLSAIFKSPEWKNMEMTGLWPVQRAFLEASRTRLCAPIQFMFPEGVSIDEDGVAIAAKPTLPSRYDMQKLDQNVRAELALADPREGGGDLSMTTMIADVVVDMVEQFCIRAKTALMDVGDDGCLTLSGRPTDDLLHNLKVANVMNAMATSIQNAPENTFVVPYRPATSAQNVEAANVCSGALLPAMQEIESTVKAMILAPLCRALNKRVAAAIAAMHQGAYLEESLVGGGGGSFVEKHLAGLYDDVAEHHLSKLPVDYATYVASTVAKYSIYAFVSNASLIRPLGETGRLHITQDLADFELALEQLVFKAGSNLSLTQVDHGKPYAELRAVRQMLFWTGLTDAAKTQSATSIAKSMLREVWVKDVRPSTVFHFLFSFAPTLLSSPHHSKRMRPQDYVQTLIDLDGSTEDGEGKAWMTTMACCDSYQQRESVDSGRDGDRRVAAILMMLGPELLRRRRH